MMKQGLWSPKLLEFFKCAHRFGRCELRGELELLEVTGLSIAVIARINFFVSFQCNVCLQRYLRYFEVLVIYLWVPKNLPLDWKQLVVYNEIAAGELVPTSPQDWKISGQYLQQG